MFSNPRQLDKMVYDSLQMKLWMLSNGKWQDVDFLASNFSGYSLEFVCIHSERIIRKHVYVSGWMRDIITEKTNQGFQYYGTNIKTINDYFIDV